MARARKRNNISISSLEIDGKFNNNNNNKEEIKAHLTNYSMNSREKILIIQKKREK